MQLLEGTIKDLIHKYGVEQILGHLIINIENINKKDELYLKRLIWDLEDTLYHYKHRHKL